MDGSTDFTDLSKLLSKYNQTGVWADGDTNYDGVINFTDLSKLLSTYNQSVGLLVPAGDTSDVPPPSLNVPNIDTQTSPTAMSLQPATAQTGDLPADTTRTTSPTLVDISWAKHSDAIMTVSAVQHQNVAAALDARLARWMFWNRVEGEPHLAAPAAQGTLDTRINHPDGTSTQHQATDGAATVRWEPTPWAAKIVDRLMSSATGDTVLGSDAPAGSLTYFDSPLDLDWIARCEAAASAINAIDEVLPVSDT